MRPEAKTNNGLGASRKAVSAVLYHTLGDCATGATTQERRGNSKPPVQGSYNAKVRVTINSSQRFSPSEPSVRGVWPLDRLNVPLSVQETSASECSESVIANSLATAESSSLQKESGNKSEMMLPAIRFTNASPRRDPSPPMKSKGDGNCTHHLDACYGASLKETFFLINLLSSGNPG